MSDISSLIDPFSNPYMDETGAASSGLYNAIFGTVSPWQANAIVSQLGSDVADAGGGPAAVTAAQNEVLHYLDTNYPEQGPFAALKQGITGDPSGQTSLLPNLSSLIVWGAVILFVIVLVATFAGSRR